MLNLTKRCDYGLIALTHLASKAGSGEARLSVRGVAEAYRMSQPLLANVMKDLARFGFVRSVRGTKGGYELAIVPEALTVGRVIEALEGPLKLTECVTAHEPGAHEPGVHEPGVHEPATESSCSLFGSCLIKRSVFLIHMKIRDALYGITIADLAKQAGGSVRAGSARLPLVTSLPVPKLAES
jgi:Rrf2 family protein